MSAKNHEIINKSTTILRRIEEELQAANPGVFVQLREPILKSEDRVDEYDPKPGTRSSHYRLMWLKDGKTGYRLACEVRQVEFTKPENVADEPDQYSWTNREDAKPGIVFIDSWPASVRVAALRHIDELTAELLRRAEKLIGDRDEASKLIESFGDLGEPDSDDRSSDDVPF